MIRYNYSQADFMFKKIVFAIAGLLVGIFIGFILPSPQSTITHLKQPPSKQIIGFLPYWLLDRANIRYDYLTTLTYFGIKADGYGHLVKLANAQEADPGWHALHSGKVDTFLHNAKNNNVKLSLLISSGDTEAINQLMEKPMEHAKTFMKEVTPVLKQYGFTDLNLDVEYSSDASPAARMHFTQFVNAVKQDMNRQQLGTLTVEISPTDVIKQNLINIHDVAQSADTIVLMAYDYHSPDSFVSGPVAPLSGAGTSSEYDVITAVKKSIDVIAPQKLVLGIPLYGYEWETLNTAVRSAIIPGSGVLASNNRMESFLTECSSCSAFFDNESAEKYVVYRDTETGTFHQIYFPDKQSVQVKIDLAKKERLGGLALWALGYEGKDMLTPLMNYK